MPRRAKPLLIRAADLAQFFPIAEAIATLLHPHAEVVIHDLASDTIVQLWNAFSRRKPGDPALLENELKLGHGQTVLGPYEKINWDGHRLKCVSCVLRDPTDQPIGLMCINVDVAQFESAAALLLALVNTPQARPTALFEHDWREQIHLALADFTKQRNITQSAMTRADKIAAIQALDQQHLFATRNAINHVAKLLSVSRATVYNWLSQARQQ